MSCRVCWGMADTILQKSSERRYTAKAREWAKKFLDEGAVPGGDVCHFPEQHMPETAPNDERKV